MLTRRFLPHALGLPLFLLAGCDAVEEPLDLEFRGDPTSPDPGGPTGPGTDPGGPTSEPTDFVVCPYRISGVDTEIGRGLPYGASSSLASRYDWNSVKRIVIAQHGRGGKAPRYFDKLTKAAQWAEDDVGIISGDTFVIAPQFIAQKDVDDENIPAWMLADVIWWKDNSSWPLASLSSDGDNLTPEYSSFHLIERLLDKHIEKMPNLQEIIITGQSAGGQAIQKFALMNAYPFPESVDVRYLPANPFAYTYLTSDRPTYEEAPDAYSFAPGNTNEAWGWAETEVCSNLVGEKLPGDFNEFHYGVVGLPTPYALEAGDDEAEVADAMRGAYAGRNVTYLIGEVDVVNKNDSDCATGVQAQGRHRRERAHAFHQHVIDEGANHHIVEVPDVGHGDALYGKACVIKVLFGVGTGCDSMDDAEIGAEWVGETTAIATGDVDDDGLVEVALLSEVNDAAEVYLLDDADHDFDVLQFVTAGWDKHHEPTDVAIGDVMGDGNPELIVGRRTEGILGGGGFVVYEKGGPVLQEAMDFGDGRNAVAVATGNVFGNPHADIGVAYDEMWAVRWEVLAWDGANFQNETFATFLDGSRPIDIQFANVQSDDEELEIIVGSDAKSGPRLYIYDPGEFTKELGAAWPDGNRLVAFDAGAFDGDAAEEIAVARKSGLWTWRVHDDASSGYAPLRSGGFGANNPTAIAMGSMGTWYGSLALAFEGLPNRVQMHTYFADADSVFGHIHRDGNLPDGAHIGSLLFADVDKHGKDELLLGRAGNFGAGWRLKVVARP